MRNSNLLSTRSRSPHPMRLQTIKEQPSRPNFDDENSSDEESKSVTVKSKLMGKGFKYALKKIAKNTN